MVRTVEFETVIVNVQGCVRSPGKVRVRGSPPTLRAALAQCRVIALLADLKRIKVIRFRPDGTHREMIVNLKAVAAQRDTDATLENGDFIVVPERII